MIGGLFLLGGGAVVTVEKARIFNGAIAAVSEKSLMALVVFRLDKAELLNGAVATALGAGGRLARQFAGRESGGY